MRVALLGPWVSEVDQNQAWKDLVLFDKRFRRFVFKFTAGLQDGPPSELMAPCLVPHILYLYYCLDSFTVLKCVNRVRTENKIHSLRLTK